MKFHDDGATKKGVITALRRLVAVPANNTRDAARAIFAEDAAFICAHPINQLHKEG